MKGLKSIGLLCVLALCISGCKGQEKDTETVQADPQDQIKEEAGETKQPGQQEQEVPEGMVQYDNGVFRLQYDPDKWMEPMAFEESDGVCAVYLFENQNGEQGEGYLTVRIGKKLPQTAEAWAEDMMRQETESGYEITDREEEKGKRYTYCLNKEIYRGICYQENESGTQALWEYWTGKDLREDLERLLSSFELYGSMEQMNLQSVVESAEISGSQMHVYYED